MRAYPFRLQFPASQLQSFSDRYQDDDDSAVLSAGQRISSGEYNRKNVETIFRWKTGGRGISRLARNSDAELHEALSLDAAAQTERCAVAVLCGLGGVGIPVASAILTCINPARYTILDFRALESLGVTDYNESIDFYLHYLAHCRELAREHSIGLRDLDRALWQSSKEKSLTAEPE